jgi:hypothetical protein
MFRWSLARSPDLTALCCLYSDAVGAAWNFTIPTTPGVFLVLSSLKLLILFGVCPDSAAALESIGPISAKLLEQGSGVEEKEHLILATAMSEVSVPSAEPLSLESGDEIVHSEAPHATSSDETDTQTAETLTQDFLPSQRLSGMHVAGETLLSEAANATPTPSDIQDFEVSTDDSTLRSRAEPESVIDRHVSTEVMREPGGDWMSNSEVVLRANNKVRSL